MVILSWLLPLIIMAAVGVVRASWPALWADELATWGMATASWHELWKVVQHMDATIAPYYAFMHGWTYLVGTSDLALRVPSIAAMAGAAGLVASIGTRLGTPRHGLIAGLLFIAVPATSRYAQEARPYALTIFFAALATYLLIACLERPRFWRFAAYAAVIMLLGATNIVALLLVAAHGLVFLVQRRSAFLGWLVATLVGLLPVAPLVYFGQGQRVQISWIPEASWDRLSQLPQNLTGTALSGGAIFALALLAFSARKPAIAYTAWALTPLVLLFVAGQHIAIWLPRYLLFTLPAWVLLAAAASARDRAIRGAFVVAMVAVVGLPTQVSIRAPGGHNQDSRAAAVYLSQNALPADVIVFGTNANGDQRVSRDVVAHYVPADRRPKDIFLVQAARANGNFAAVECPNLAQCLGEHDRLWILRLGTLSDPLSNIGKEKAALLRASYTVLDVTHPKGFTVALLIRKAETSAVGR
jgi:mannosyltransferase